MERRDLLALSTFLMPIAILRNKPLFWDEMLYVYLAKLIRANPLDPFPEVPIYVPHPPGMLYWLAYMPLPPRAAMFLLALLLLVLYREVEPRAFLAGGAPLIAIYSAIVFDDAVGAISASAAATAVLNRRYKLAAVLFFLASRLRYQSAIAAMGFAFVYAILRRERRDFAATLPGTIPIAMFFIMYSNRAPASHQSIIYALGMYAILLFLPHVMLLMLPLMRDRDSIIMLLVNYARNVSTLKVFDRYYLTTIAFAAPRLKGNLRWYRYYALVISIASVAYAAFSEPILLSTLIVPIYFALTSDDNIEHFLSASRAITITSVYMIYAYALPHPCMRRYLYRVI